jgi:hypothetical protein
MLKTPALTGLLIAAVASPAVVLADHNSKWGEGWANMPNDIHNTRVETRGDNTAFRDFVKKGNGADSVNRFSTSDSQGRRQQFSTGSQRSAVTSSRRGSSSGNGGRGRH